MIDVISEQLTKGNWPIVLLLLLFAGIVIEVRRFAKSNDVRHKEHSHMDKLLSENIVKLTTITEVHESEINGLKEDVKDVRFEFRVRKTGK